ncbi:MAG: DUF2799 domain-containing protein [Candidatus Heimdallarchaeota archaeon]|nr:DUF2799 domain-containing protein [Candidatus Heimdallarchaeota archaeon]
MTVLISCASLSKEQCSGIDLAGRGKKDALFGSSQYRFGEYESQCSKYSIKLDEDKYRQGFSDGLTIYCSPYNASKAGREGKDFNYALCQSEKNIYLLPEYNKGKVEYYNSSTQETKKAITELENSFSQFNEVFKTKYLDSSSDAILKQRYRSLADAINKLQREKNNLSKRQLN